MHGLINRAIEVYIRDTHGDAVWDDIMEQADLGFTQFETMLHYKNSQTETVLEVAANKLDRSRADLLTDIGTFLVSPGKAERIRRLLRFGGEGFLEFLHSLDDLADRARMAVPDLDLPRMKLADHSDSEFTLECEGAIPGVGYVMVGLLQAMADDYGTLAFIDFDDTDLGQKVGAKEKVSITVLEQAFATGREFSLGASA